MGFNTTYQFQYLSSSSQMESPNNVSVIVQRQGTGEGGGGWTVTITLDLQGRQSLQMTLPLKSLQQRLAHACKTADVKPGDIVDSAVEVVDTLSEVTTRTDPLNAFHDHLRLGFPWIGTYDSKVQEPTVLAVLVFAGLRKAKFRIDDLTA